MAFENVSWIWRKLTYFLIWLITTLSGALRSRLCRVRRLFYFSIVVLGVDA
jgi:hypothetical protein